MKVRQECLPGGVQGATVLHCLARLYEIAIQGATQGATKCNIGCYIFKTAHELMLSSNLRGKSDWNGLA